jgi:PAS domain S-box-containing protein
VRWAKPLDRWQVTPMVALSGAFVLIFAGLIVAFYTQAATRQQKLNEAQVQAQVIAASVAGALAFQDPAASEQYLGALQRNPEVAAAGAYDERGRLVASYSRTPGEAPSRTAPAAGASAKDNHFIVVVPVTEGSTRLGSVYLRTDAETWVKRARRYAGMALLVLMGSLLIGVLAVAQSTVRSANARLSRQADDLRAIATRQSAIFDAAFDAIVTLNPSGGIEGVNHAAERMFGYPLEDLRRRDISLLIDLAGEAEGTFLQRVGAPQGSGEGVVKEVTGRRKDGSEFPVDIALGAMEQPDGTHVVAVMRDITDRKKADQLKQEFVSTVSHELRTPLTSIAGSLGLLTGGAGGELPATAARLVGIAHSNCQRLVRLINDILDIEKLESGKLRFHLAPVAVDELVLPAADGLRGYADEFGVRLNVGETPSDLRVRGDSDRLIQVLTNILSNALKFSPRDEAVDVSVSRQGQFARISVRDHGQGIPDAFQARVFTKFAQADSTDTRQKGGTGLGLAISKEIVERHGGRLWFEAADGRGTVFHIDLPVIDLPPPSAAAEGAERLLICEDDPDVAAILRDTLEADGFAVDVTGSLQEAADALLAPSRYAALLLDLKLPDGDGIGLIHALREQHETRNLPIIVVSAYVDDGREAAKALSLNLVDWMAKPVDVDVLRSVVSAALARAAATDRQPAILHVDDDPDILRMTAVALTGLGRIISVDGLAAARAVLRDERPDLVILDISLGDGSGLELLPELNAFEDDIPVVVFSAQDTDPALLQRVDEVLVKSRSSVASLARTVRRLVRDSQAPRGG